jgi:CSLREA domain-containing protein
MLLLIASAATAATFSVDTTNDAVDAAPGDGVCADVAARCSLRAAVMEANATVGADAVDVPPGLYALTLAGPGEEGDDLDVLDDLTVRGDGRINTTISGVRARRVMWSDTASLTLEDLTLTEGVAPIGEDGGAVYASGIVHATRVDVTDSEAKNGAGFYVDGEVHLEDVRFEYCISEWVGTAVRSHSGGTLVNVVARENTSSIGYPIIQFEGSVTVEDSLFEDNEGDALYVEGDVDITRTIARGNEGNAISVAGDVVASDLQVMDNAGDGLSVDGRTAPSIVVTRSRFVRNGGNGLESRYDPLAWTEVTDSVFADNGGAGAGISVEEALLERNQFNRNQEYGLALHSEGSSLVSDAEALGNGTVGMYFASYEYGAIEVVDATIARSEGRDEYRALLLDGPGSTLLRRVSVTDNPFGGVELYPGTNVTFEDSVIARNSIYAVYSYYFFPIEGSAIYAEDATLTLRGTDIVGNRGIGTRGAVYAYDTDLVMEDCLVDGNVTDYYDPGVVGSARRGSAYSITIAGTTFSNNVGSGSVLHANPFTTVTNSSFVYNSAGDVIQSQGDDVLDLANVTIVANIVIDGNGAIFLYDSSTAALNGVTIAGNRTPDLDPYAVAGLYIDDPAGLVEVGNSIIASNVGPAGPADAYGTLTSLGGNLIGEADLVVGIGADDLVGTRAAPVRPGLAPLFTPPGGTAVAALRPGSVARDAGNDAICLPDDQIGAPRPADGDGDGFAQCDIGAVEGP